MKVKVDRLKKIAIALFALPLLAVVLLNPASGQPQTPAADPKDAAAFFASKCKMCHGASAEKHFDGTKADDDLVQIVLKGKADATPKMPAYETKGVDAEQAKALIAYMKSLKK
jgi:mono/diheme cytochrome c family protein